jgi:hypothetical protein
MDLVNGKFCDLKGGACDIVCSRKGELHRSTTKNIECNDDFLSILFLLFSFDFSYDLNFLFLEINIRL